MSQATEKTRRIPLDVNAYYVNVNDMPWEKTSLPGSA